MNKILLSAVALALAGFFCITTTGVDLVSSRVGLGFLVLGLGGFVVSVGETMNPSRCYRGRLIILTCLGGSYFIFSALSAGPIGLAMPDIVLVLTFLGIYFLTSLVGDRGKALLVYALLLVWVVNGAVSLTQIFSEQGFFIWKPDPDKGKLITGLFGHYNPFAAFLNGSVFFVLTYAFLGKKISWRIVSGITVAWILVTLILSGSRGGWVGFVIGAAVWIVVTLTYLKQKKSEFFGLALILGLIVAVLGLTSSFWVVQKLTDKRAEKAIELSGRKGPTEVQDGGRLAYQQLAFEVFLDSPIVGSGPRAFSYLSLDKWDKEKLNMWENPPDFAHNEFLQTLSDYGLVGLIIIGGLTLLHVVFGTYNSVSSHNPDSGLPLLQMGAIGGLISILSQCSFSFLLHTPTCMALVALQVGILGARTTSSQRGEGAALVNRGIGGLGVTIFSLLMALGGILTHSYSLSRKASRELVSVNDSESAFRVLETMSDAGNVGRDPKIFEVAGRLSMKFANDALVDKNHELARRFNQKAKTAFQSSLKYNPHFAAGIAGLPRVEEALGNWEEAEIGHELAMEKLWSREYRLRTHLYGAQSSFAAALRKFHTGEKANALLDLREGRRRILRRREILQRIRELDDEKRVRVDMESWIAFMEARLLFKEADDIWKNARPRNPELAYALMLEAQKRYQASEAVVREKYPNWEKQVERLELSLGYLQAGQVRPAKLSEEQIIAIIGSEEDLDSPALSR